MAKGRMLSTSISKSKQVHELSCDTCRLAFSWTIPHLDKEGRIVGEPDLLRALVFPRRKDVTDEQFEGYIEEWLRSNSGVTPLALRYSAGDGDRYLYFPGFERHQRGLRKDREGESIIPAPTPEQLRSNSGVAPDEDNINTTTSTTSTEGEQGKPKRRNRQLLEDLMPGNVGSKELSWLGKAEEEYGNPEVREVLVMADGENLDRPIAWIKRVLANRRKEGIDKGAIQWKEIDWNDRELLEAGIPVEKYKGKRLIGAPEGVHT